MTPPLDPPVVALAIAAHPDDVEFWCGATLARWAAAGAVVHHLICTDGSKGTWDANADLAALVARRQDEQRGAAQRLGATGEVVMLGVVDGELTNDRATRSVIAEHIRRLRPNVVFGHDPWKRYRLHPDHRAAGFLAVDSVVAARDPHFFPEHLVPHHRPDAILLFEAQEVNHLEPAEESHIAARVAALEAHESQFETTHFSGVADPDQLAGFRTAERDKLRAAAASYRALIDPTCVAEYGEAFHLITDV